MKVEIEFISHDQQRYDTCGDWQWTGDDLKISISETGDWRANMAVAVHELVEVILCKDKGITQESVDRYDLKSTSTDPGDCVDAPYRDQHCFATAVERMLVAAFGMSWKEYENRIMAMEYNKQ